MNDQDKRGLDQCSRPGCESDPIALFSNGPFQEPRCDEHSSDWLTVVREL